jgi:anti-sigma factor RsiW
MKISDETLTAFLDGELDDAAAGELARQVEADAALQARLSALDLNLGSIRKDYTELNKTAPLAALRAAIQADAAAPMAANSNARGWSNPAIAAACAACLAFGVFISPFVASFVPGLKNPVSEIAGTSQKSWRQSVAEYQALYAAETLTLNPQDPVKQDETLAKLSARVGVPLERQRLQLDKASFQRGQLLNFDGNPLVQLAFLYDGDKPVAVCLIANGAKDAAPASEVRKGMPLVHWAHGGVSYMVIGQIKAGELTAMAGALQGQI